MKRVLLFLLFSLLWASPSFSDCRQDDLYVQIEQCTTAAINAGNDADKSSAYLYRCQAYDMLGQYEAAIVDCKRARDLNSDDSSIYNSLSIIYQNLENWPSAVAASSEAIALNGDIPGYWNVRANAYCSAGRVDKSVEDRIQAMRKGSFSEQGLQEYLRDRGYYNGAIDGTFSESSEDALRRWTADGC